MAIEELIARHGEWVEWKRRWEGMAISSTNFPWLARTLHGVVLVFSHLYQFVWVCEFVNICCFCIVLETIFGLNHKYKLNYVIPNSTIIVFLFTQCYLHLLTFDLVRRFKKGILQEMAYINVWEKSSVSNDLHDCKYYKTFWAFCNQTVQLK